MDGTTEFVCNKINTTIQSKHYMTVYVYDFMYTCEHNELIENCQWGNVFFVEICNFNIHGGNDDFSHQKIHQYHL